MGARLEKKKTRLPGVWNVAGKAWGWSHIIRSRLPFWGAGRLWSKSEQDCTGGESNSRLCFSLPTVAQFAARPMCTCEPEDEKASSLTLGDELRYKPAIGKKKKKKELHNWLALSVGWAPTSCWTSLKPCGVAWVSGSLRAYLDGFCAAE